MAQFPPLADLGRRIAVIGPSNAGKSTVARALARKLELPAIHLDQLRHLPNTRWQERPDAEFWALHDAAVDQERWVMDGNYSALLQRRLARATGIVVVDDTYLVRTGRYIRRTLFEPDRAGGLEGNRDRISWEMLRWLWKTRDSGERLRRAALGSGLPTASCRALRDVLKLYALWGLPRIAQ